MAVYAHPSVTCGMDHRTRELGMGEAGESIGFRGSRFQVQTGPVGLNDPAGSGCLVAA